MEIPHSPQTPSHAAKAAAVVLPMLFSQGCDQLDELRSRIHTATAPRPAQVSLDDPASMSATQAVDNTVQALKGTGHFVEIPCENLSIDRPDHFDGGRWTPKNVVWEKGAG